MSCSRHCGGSTGSALEGPPGGGLRFVVVARLAGTQLVRFKVDVSAADVVTGDIESYLSDPVVERLGFRRSRFPVYPVNQHFAEKLHALTGVARCGVDGFPLHCESA